MSYLVEFCGFFLERLEGVDLLVCHTDTRFLIFLMTLKIECSVNVLW